jgi:hypothetical protein
MATKRAPVKRRKKRSASRVPAIFLAGIIAGVGGLLLVRAAEESSDSTDPDVISVDGSESPATGEVDGSDNSSEPSDSDGTDGGEPTPATDPSNLGKPVQIFSDTLGDLDIDQVIDDWTRVDPPVISLRTAEVNSNLVQNGRITSDLPDGFYWGVAINTFDEIERGITFDIRQAFFGDACRQRFGTGDDVCNNDYGITPQSGQQLYPSFLSDLLFVSMAVLESAGTENTAVVPASFWSLMNAGLPTTVAIPSDSNDQKSALLVNTPFLLTIVDGAIIAAEGIWVP